MINPAVLGEEYGSDVLRYYLLRSFSPFEDGDFSTERLKEVYNSDLANGLGNLVSRISKLCESSNLEFKDYKPKLRGSLSPELEMALKGFMKAWNFANGTLEIPAKS